MMKADLDELRETAALWNKENRVKKKEEKFYLKALLILIPLSLSFGIITKDIFLSFIMFYIAAVIMSVHKYLKKKSAIRDGTLFSEKLKGLDEQKVARFKFTVEDALNSFSKNRPSAFGFYHSESNGKKYKQKFEWVAKFRGDHFIVLRKSMDEVHFPDLEDFEIRKGVIGPFENDYSADAFINGKYYKIHISPASYNKFINCLEHNFVEEGREKEAG